MRYSLADSCNESSHGHAASALEWISLHPLAGFVVSLGPLAVLVALVPGMRYHQPAASREHVPEQRVSATCEIGVLEREDITPPAAAGTRGVTPAGVVEEHIYEVAGLCVVAKILGDVVWLQFRRAGLLVVPDHDPVIAERLFTVVCGARPVRRLSRQEIAGAGPVTEKAAQLIQLRRHFVLGAGLPEVQQGGCARDGGEEGGGG